MARTRTNIEIDDDHLRAVMERYGVHTKTEAVDLALRHLAGQPMTRTEALAMRGARAIGDVEDAGPLPSRSSSWTARPGSSSTGRRAVRSTGV